MRPKIDNIKINKNVRKRLKSRAKYYTMHIILIIVSIDSKYVNVCNIVYILTS